MSYGVQNNRDLALDYGTHWISYNSMLGFLGAGGVGGFLGAGATSELLLVSAPGVASELAGVPLTTADEMYHWMPIPNEWDMTSNLEMRLFWHEEAAGADTDIGFTCKYRFYAQQATIDDCGATPDKTVTFALVSPNTTIGATSYSAWTPMQTVGVYDSADTSWAFVVTMLDDGTADPDEIQFLGCEIRFARNLCTGGRSYAA